MGNTGRKRISKAGGGKVTVRTIRQARENACKEPFAFLAEELRVVVLSAGTPALHLVIIYRKDALPIRIPQRDVDMTVISISMKLTTPAGIVVD